MESRRGYKRGGERAIRDNGEDSRESSNTTGVECSQEFVYSVEGEDSEAETAKR